jgi:chromosome segregation ATPase
MKYIFAACLSLILITSCNSKKSEGENSKETVYNDRDSLINLNKEREESLNELIASFNEIERNLDSVAVKQQIIYANTENKSRDLKRDQKNRIISEIQAINTLMNQNTELVASLKRKLSRSNKKNKQLDETVQTLTSQLEQKTIELNALNERLTQLDAEVAQLKTSVDTLTAQNLSKENTIKGHVTDLHTAYYVIGKTKELQAANLIDKKGGLLGIIGRTPELSENFDQNKFTKIDYTQTGSIPVNSSKAKIITVHPAGTYTIEKDKDMVKNIVITDPEKFWSASKYLVIVKS